jgi:hypothetical protein
MAFVVPCPKCGVRLKCNRQLPAGSQLSCPACQHGFFTEEEAVPFVVAPAHRPKDIPAAIILADAQELPEGDRPSVSRPKRQRLGPRPARRDPTTQRARIRPGLLLGLLAGTFALALAVAIGIYLLLRDTSKPASNELLVHAPTDSVILSGYDLEELAADPAFRRALEKRAPADLVELDRAGLRSADLSRVLVARTVNNGNTCAIRFKEAPNRAKYLQADLPGKPYAPFTSVAGRYRFGYFADPKTLVLADREQALQTLLEKGPKVRIATELNEMVDKVRGPIWRASGRISAAEHSRLTTGDDGLALRVGPSAGTATWGIPDDGLVLIQLDLAFETKAEAAQGAGVLRDAFVNLRAFNEFGQLIGREGIDPADISYVRRGYEEAEVTEVGNHTHAKLRLPAWEAIRVVGSVRN